MGMDVFGKQPDSEAGKYFRASVWSWRPIHAMCEHVLQRELPWHTNDGEGFDTQAECNELANALEQFLEETDDDNFEIEGKVQVDRDTGQLLLHKTENSRSAYSTNREHVQNFIEFLRHCGGFAIC